MANELVQAAQTILGPQEKCFAVGVDVNRGVDETLEEVRGAIRNAGDQCGVLIMTDLFGGSPTTMSLSLLKSETIEVVTGVNLPMVISAIQGRKMNLEKLASTVKDAGQQGIMVAGAMLRRKTRK
ncbi:PTS sugar transporter subunit IIA [Pseudodesulfovibrio tunisiensis]|uniref:PTS sugar transporter subunit IIA n=1 Tax=Pseudodesulfovibrio tunisiensis TaxID=463192 RepID=UPI001FB5067A|nr:PTS sugar transporter subunit IIA [Pseudodesulfovibrio tunisiensis]